MNVYQRLSTWAIELQASLLFVVAMTEETALEGGPKELTNVDLNKEEIDKCVMYVADTGEEKK